MRRGIGQLIVVFKYSIIDAIVGVSRRAYRTEWRHRRKIVDGKRRLSRRQATGGPPRIGTHRTQTAKGCRYNGATSERRAHARTTNLGLEDP